MREVLIAKECLDFIEKQDDSTQKKFYQLIEVISEIKVVNTNFVKRIINTEFY